MYEGIPIIGKKDYDEIGIRALAEIAGVYVEEIQNGGREGRKVLKVLSQHLDESEQDIEIALKKTHNILQNYSRKKTPILFT